jgi:hypothetical protein
MRTILGLVFIVVATALALNVAKHVPDSGGDSALVAADIVAMLIALTLGIIGFKWIRRPGAQPTR